MSTCKECRRRTSKTYWNEETRTWDHLCAVHAPRTVTILESDYGKLKAKAKERDKALADLEEAREHRRILREALEMYGRHFWMCTAEYGVPERDPELCDCGLRAALAATEETCKA